MRPKSAALAALLCCVPAGVAQCPFSSVQLVAYGSACNPVFLQLPTLSGALAAPPCELQLTVQAYTGCCNTFLRFHGLVLGLAATSVPLPQAGPGCVLLASPDVVLLQQASASGLFRFPLPPGLPPFTLAAQGAALYVTFGVSPDWALTQGQMVSLQ